MSDTKVNLHVDGPRRVVIVTRTNPLALGPDTIEIPWGLYKQGAGLILQHEGKIEQAAAVPLLVKPA